MSQAKVIFDYKDIKINIPCLSNEKIRNIIERFTTIIQIDKNKTIFFYDGDKINEELNFNELANEEDRAKNQINIILFEINNIVRCPRCQENLFLKVEDTKINLYNSKNNKIEHLNINSSKNESYNNNKIEYENINDIKNEPQEQNIKKEIIKEKNIIKDRKSLWYKSINENENEMNDLNIYIGKFVANTYEIINKLKDLLNNIIIYNKRINLKNNDNNQDYEISSNKNDNEIIFKNEIIETVKETTNDNSNENKFKKMMKIYKILNLKINNNQNYNNYIIGEIVLTELQILKINYNYNNIRLIGSYEEYKRNNNIKDKKDEYLYENEKEIKDSCIIEINNKIIPFSYFYKFKDTGKYIIKYTFIKEIINPNYLFYNCYRLKELNLSHFKTQNAISMKGMFYNCCDLTSLDLTNFNTDNCKSLKDMFSGCYSLKKKGLVTDNKNILKAF